MPSGTPTARDSATATSISASVWMLLSQSPSAAKDANAASMIAPARRPPKRSARSVLNAVVPTQVSFVSAVYSQLTRCRGRS